MTAVLETRHAGGGSPGLSAVGDSGWDLILVPRHGEQGPSRNASIAKASRGKGWQTAFKTNAGSQISHFQH